MKRVIPLLLVLALIVSMLAACGPNEPAGSASPTPPASTTPATSEPPVVEEKYIPAPYTANSPEELMAQIYTPVFYENQGGPTIGVTLLGVIQIGDQYFRDLNNNQKLDDFEDWRLDVDTRAAAYAASLSDFQLTHEVDNVAVFSPNNARKADVVDESGNPVWGLIIPDGSGSGGYANSVDYFNTAGFRNFVVRNNPETEVGVWFNNGMEQYAEYDAIQTGTTAVPFLSFTNPIGHGMPGPDGVAAAALGDGNADFVLTDSQYDRIIMWYKGIDGIYGPQIDLVTDPRWSRNSGTYGEREDTTAEIARNLTIGYQNGDQGMVPGSVLLTVKHFPGDGAAYNGFESHGQTGRYRVYSTENSLANYQLKPFIAAFEAGAAGIMPGYSQPIVDARIAKQEITYKGQTYDIRYGGRGNAFNEDILMKLAREILGFGGLINSDSLMTNAQQGVEDLSSYERMVLFIKSGCDAGVISFDDASASEMLTQALANGDLTRADLERAAANRAKPRMQNGDMENPYRDLEESVAAVNEVMPKVQALAEETNLKSVVLMKNSGNALPLQDAGKKVYVHGFNQRDNADVSGIVAALEAQGFTIVEDYNNADIAYLRVSPTIVGQGSNQLAILDLAEDVETPLYDNNAKRTGETASVTTVADMKTVKRVADAIHAKGGTVIGEIDATSPWILSNMEPYCDALLGTYGSSDSAIAQVVAGKYAPTGKLAITMVADASVIALVETDLDGEIWDVCVSPNDVPGYVKDQYMDAAVLAASPSGSYAYKDADGNFYKSGFGLTFTANPNGPSSSGTPSGTDTPAGSSTPNTPSVSTDPAATGLNFSSEVTALEGTWKLAQVYAGGETKAAVADAMDLKITLEEDPSELVDGPAYIHNRVYNLTGMLTFGVQAAKSELAADDVDGYKGSTSWVDFPQGEVVDEGGWYKQPGPATMRFKDIDDYGLYLDQVAGISANIDTTEKNLILGMNAAGQLLLGYSEAHIERPGTSGEWVYCLIFDKA